MDLTEAEDIKKRWQEYFMVANNKKKKKKNQVSTYFYAFMAQLIFSKFSFIFLGYIVHL